METRFSDQHVRSHPALRDIATAYLQNYPGEFDPMIAARDLLRATGELPTPIVRMVLNVMRADPRAVHLLPNLEPVPDVHERESFASAVRRVTAKPAERTRPVRIDLKVKWNKGFIAATTKNATAYHLLNPDASTLRYWPYVGKYRIDLRTWCGQHLTTGVALDNPPAGRHECKQCASNKTIIEVRTLDNQARIDKLKESVA